MAHSASVAAQRLDVLEAEVARLRQVIEERLAYPVPLNDEAEFLIPVTEAARLHPPVTARAGATLLPLPSKRPHPTFVETTLPQYCRLVRVPDLS
jgi:hypothetical protein